MKQVVKQATRRHATAFGVYRTWLPLGQEVLESVMIRAGATVKKVGSIVRFDNMNVNQAVTRRVNKIFKNELSFYLF